MSDPALNAIFNLRYYRIKEKWMLTREGETRKFSRDNDGKEKGGPPQKRDLVSRTINQMKVNEASANLNEAFVETGPNSPDTKDVTDGTEPILHPYTPLRRPLPPSMTHPPVPTWHEREIVLMINRHAMAMRGRGRGVCPALRMRKGYYDRLDSVAPDPAYSHISSGQALLHDSLSSTSVDSEEFMAGAQEAAHSSEIELSDEDAPIQRAGNLRRSPSVHPTLVKQDVFLGGSFLDVAVFDGRMGRGRGRLPRGAGRWS